MNRTLFLGICAALLVILVIALLVLHGGSLLDQWWKLLVFGLLILGIVALVVFTWMSERNRSIEE